MSGGDDNVDVMDATAASNTTQNFSEEHQYSKTLTEKRRHNQSPRLPFSNQMVLKITSVHNTSQRHMAEKEAKLLQMLSHPSIIQVYDHGFRESRSADESSSNTDTTSVHSSRIDVSNINNAITLSNMNDHMLSSKLAQHLILMEYCEGGTAFDAIKRMKSSSPPTSLNPVSNNSTISHRFDLPSLVISFGQICNAVSYLHAQRPPIIHRDLKPVNFLIKNGAYKLCDFGSAVMGHTDLRTPESRRKVEEVVNKTTTQMFRAPEMVDLYMAKRLTQSTDVWALGCCLYSLAFLRDCFEEGSNLAILSRKFKIPDHHPYGEGLVDLIDRMLAGDYRERADMSEVIMCLSALYSHRPLPKRRQAGKLREEGKGGHRMGAYRTDGQGIRQNAPVKKKTKKIVEAKKLNPNSAAAKRKKASEGQKQNKLMPPSQVVSDHCDGRSHAKISHPSLVDNSFQNFASFDRVFKGNFDHCCNRDDDGSILDCGTTTEGNETFSSTFHERCQISVAPSSQAATDIRKSCVDGAVEVTFQGSASTTSFEPPANHNFLNESFRNVSGTSSQLTAFGSSGLHNGEGSIISGKKKRGLFGVRGKSNASKF
eukprot:CAMPEP_0172331796 /NCGR_PEP_ID=MMETSP1058-20130122/62108_1 /TAXON_ID=83371 /ORGANISM="Detonula confervacea, Strain CCMP 353" /LENGTH=595 /DNA_ID=CAMNT_0013049069 /DNA_START=133 /DNA_END=1920 /DNA_ORIENTATION=-